MTAVRMFVFGVLGLVLAIAIAAPVPAVAEILGA